MHKRERTQEKKTHHEETQISKMTEAWARRQTSTLQVSQDRTNTSPSDYTFCTRKSLLAALIGKSSALVWFVQAAPFVTQQIAKWTQVQAGKFSYVQSYLALTSPFQVLVSHN